MANLFIRLETVRLVLRDHVQEDLATHHTLLSDTKTMYYLQDLQTSTLKQTAENLNLAISEIGKKDRTCYFLRIETRDGKRFVGEIGYTVLEFTPLGKLVHLGYFTHPCFWNQGYAAEALREVLRFAFEENGVYRVSTGCICENRGSERVMQKCGMVKEGEFRHAQWHDGKMKDRVAYRLLREEWADTCGKNDNG